MMLQGLFFGGTGNVQMVHMGLLESVLMESWEPPVDGTMDMRMARMGSWWGEISLHGLIRIGGGKLSMRFQGPHFGGARGPTNGSWQVIQISANRVVRAAFWWDSGHVNSSYGLVVRCISIWRYYHMDSFNSAGQTTDGYHKGCFVVATKCECLYHVYGPIDGTAKMVGCPHWNCGYCMLIS